MGLDRWCNAQRLDTCPCSSGAMDKGVVTSYGEGGGAIKREVQAKFYPYEKGGVKSFSHPEGGNKTFWGSFYN